MRVLSSLIAGERALVYELTGGREMIRRLAEMGLSPGTPFLVVRGGGPVILECRGHRLIVGRGMADRLMVSDEAPDRGGPPVPS